jgi:Heparinase II/III N-terminus/Heparinase II/III-like protein
LKSRELDIEKIKNKIYYIKKLPLHVGINIVLKKICHAAVNYIQKIKYKIWKDPLSIKIDKIYDLNEFRIDDLYNKLTYRYNFIIDDNEKSEIIYIINRNFKKWFFRSIEKANNICNNEFTILGETHKLNKEINWHKDYQRGYEWPLKYHKEIKLINLNDDSDIKIPWELSRFHHGTFLGKAYALTGDDKYAKEFYCQLSDWIYKNPPFIGVNWTCTMEVAIRAINFIWSIFFFKDSKYFSSEIKDLFLKSIYYHGEFIYKNLEINWRVINGKYRTVNNNHFVANIVGLLYISLVFSEIKKAKKWFLLAYEGLIDIVQNQIGEDGVHYEYSPNYHRLVLELILLALIILIKFKIEIPSEVWTKTERMLEFVKYYIKPNGESPCVRDIDNGRVIILGNEELINHSHILAIGAVIFERSDFTKFGICEDVLWLLGENGFKKFNELKKNKTDIASRGFEESGFYIFRNENLYMLAICSGVGMYGFCGHTHNDFLSFDLFAYDKSFITDSGSYVYGRYPKWRNKFRSVYFHNTAVIDGNEINNLDDREIFKIGNDVTPRTNLWKTDQNTDFLNAEYSIEINGSEIVTHQRKFYFNKRNNYWIIKDFIRGQKQHKIESLLHFDESVNIVIENDSCIRTVCEQGANLIIIPISEKKIKVSKREGWISKTYDNKTKRQVAIIHYEGFLPLEICYLLFPVPHPKDEKETPPLEKSYNDYLAVKKKFRDKVDICKKIDIWEN